MAETTTREEALRTLGEWTEANAAQIMEALAQTAVVYHDVEPIDRGRRWIARYHELRALLGGTGPAVLTAESLAAFNPPVEQCADQTCREDGPEVVDGKPYCTPHAEMVRKHGPIEVPDKPVEIRASEPGKQRYANPPLGRRHSWRDGEEWADIAEDQTRDLIDRWEADRIADEQSRTVTPDEGEHIEWAGEDGQEP